MSLVFVGYLPKRIEPRPEGFDVPHVLEIWSASGCISSLPDGWIDHWVHNRLGLFDSIALAQSVVPPDQVRTFQIVAYRVWDQVFDVGGRRPLDGAGLCPLPPGPEFATIGYDAVSSTTETGFECSPLSCNYLARTLRTNEYCLFRSLEEAIDGAEAFVSGNCEPGPYYVVEVLRRHPNPGAQE